MSNQFDLKAAACKVYAILTDNADARDDDKILIVEIWSKESKAKDIQGLFKELMEGSISFPDTLTRMRRKLQEEHPALRGKMWDMRHNMEGNICQQLDFFDKW